MNPTRTLDQLLRTDCIGPVQRGEALAAIAPLKEYLSNIGSRNEITRELRVLLTGSALFNGAGNDMDALVLVPDISDFANLLGDFGWSLCSKKEYPEEDFIPMRKGYVNVLLLSDRDLFHRWCTAGALCWDYARKNGGIDKDTRVDVHRIVTNEDAVGADLLEFTNLKEAHRAAANPT